MGTPLQSVGDKVNQRKRNQTKDALPRTHPGRHRRLRLDPDEGLEGRLALGQPGMPVQLPHLCRLAGPGKATAAQWTLQELVGATSTTSPPARTSPTPQGSRPTRGLTKLAPPLRRTLATTTMSSLPTLPLSTTSLPTPCQLTNTSQPTLPQFTKSQLTLSPSTSRTTSTAPTPEHTRMQVRLPSRMQLLVKRKLLIKLFSGSQLRQ